MLPVLPVEIQILQQRLQQAVVWSQWMVVAAAVVPPVAIVPTVAPLVVTGNKQYSAVY
jgi:hypothetical protein